MYVYNNKEYRNLQEQVQKNKADIEDWKSKQETLANWGIKIVGQIESESDLPEDYSGEYGDAYQVGTGDSAKYFAWIRPTTEVAKDHWMDMGSLSIAGPQGPAGDEITEIENTGATSTTHGTNVVTYNTIKVTMSDGRTIEFMVNSYGLKGDKGDQGVQGIQGIQGIQGDKGDKGDVGPQGEMGPTAPAYHIIGTVTSTSQLPDPEVLKDLSGAYIVEESGAKNLYIQIGKTLEEAKWTFLGELSAANYWELSGSTIAPVEAVDLVQINNLDVLNSFSCKNPSITGTISGSAIKSPANLSLAGTTGVDIINNGFSVLKVASNNQVSFPQAWTQAGNGDFNLWTADNSNMFYKSKNVTINPATGELKATKITANNGTITSKWFISNDGAFKGSLQGGTRVTATSNIDTAIDTFLTYYPAVKKGASDVPDDLQVISLGWDTGNSWAYQIGCLHLPEKPYLYVRGKSYSWGNWCTVPLLEVDNTFTGSNKFTGNTNITSLMVNGAQVETVRRHVSEATIAGVNELLVSMQNGDITSMDIHGDFAIAVGNSSGGGEEIHCYQAHVEYNGEYYLVTCIKQNGTSYMPQSGDQCTISDSGEWFSVDYDLAV